MLKLLLYTTPQEKLIIAVVVLLVVAMVLANVFGVSFGNPLTTALSK